MNWSYNPVINHDLWGNADYVDGCEKIVIKSKCLSVYKNWVKRSSVDLLMFNFALYILQIFG